MDFDRRLVYTELTKELGHGISGVCKYAHNGDGEWSCRHSLWPKLRKKASCRCPGNNCWGFRPNMALKDLVTLVSITKVYCIEVNL